MVPLENDGAAVPLLAESYAERDARFSPDGHWVAYVAEESGHPEVVVRNVFDVPRRMVISAEGGAQPVWRRDGAELFFVDLEGRPSSVPVNWSAAGVPTFGLPVELDVPSIGVGHWGTQYDVAPDGASFYFMPRNDDPSPNELHVVLGWHALLD